MSLDGDIHHDFDVRDAIHYIITDNDVFSMESLGV